MFDVQILNVFGQKVLNLINREPKIDVRHLAEGVYFLQLTKNGIARSSKFVIQR